jgi:hypothetical protein
MINERALPLAIGNNKEHAKNDQTLLDKAFQNCYFLTLTAAYKRYWFPLLTTSVQPKASAGQFDRKIDIFERFLFVKLLSLVGYGPRHHKQI